MSKTIRDGRDTGDGDTPTQQAESPAQENQALLRRFEPTIRYTRGEQFYPMAIEPYVRESSLWVRRPDEDPHRVIPERALTEENLAEPREDPFGTVYFLRFIEPLQIASLAAYSLKSSRRKREAIDIFRAGRGRLARVGYASRLVDALFSVTLLARGRVPGATAAAAAIAYRRIMAEQEGEPQQCYYGRVARQDGWIALQYWFFYPFNNWRSGFFGVNDHEADWELVCIYLSESGVEERGPEWVAYSSHEFTGDDLRRRWDDPEVEKLGEHPVIYAGAGSHASYFSRGEYLTEVPLPFLAPISRIADLLIHLWFGLLGRAPRQRGAQDEGAPLSIFRIPFVDYARGDGVSIGPGGNRAWDEPRLLDPVPGWVSGYRGLWGLYARDVIAGEDAPAGPMYNRDGSVRRAWRDPLGWAGLDKVPPPAEALFRVQTRADEVQAQCATLAATLDEKSREVTGLGVQVAAMRGRPHLGKLHETYRNQIVACSAEIDRLRATLTSQQAELEALELYEQRLRAGVPDPARGHIRRAFHPASDAELRLSRVAEIWAAISVGLMLLSFVAVAIFARQYLILSLAALISLLVFVEAGFRQRLTQVVNSVTVGLSIVCTLIILFEFFWEAIILAVLVAAVYMMWDNLRELWR